MSKIFLGGTCAESTWREELKPVLQVDYFDPVVEDWTDECQKTERYEKGICNIHLYVITKEMIGVFSIAEAVESACQKDKHVIFHVIPDGLGESELKSLCAVVDMISAHGGSAYVDSDINRTARVINNSYK